MRKNKWGPVIDFVKAKSGCRSLRKLGERTGLEHSTIARIRRGGTNPHLETLEKLGSAIEMTGDELWSMANQS
jgi:transcriptional regulator with XRE-family HTH domain